MKLKHKQALKQAFIIIAICIVTAAITAAVLSWQRRQALSKGGCTTSVLNETSVLGKKGEKITVCP